MDTSRCRAFFAAAGPYEYTCEASASTSSWASTAAVARAARAGRFAAAAACTVGAGDTRSCTFAISPTATTTRIDLNNPELI